MVNENVAEDSSEEKLLGGEVKIRWKDYGLFILYAFLFLLNNYYSIKCQAFFNIFLFIFAPFVLNLDVIHRRAFFGQTKKQQLAEEMNENTAEESSDEEVLEQEETVGYSCGKYLRGSLFRWKDHFVEDTRISIIIAKLFAFSFQILAWYIEYLLIKHVFQWHRKRYVPYDQMLGGVCFVLAWIFLGVCWFIGIAQDWMAGIFIDKFFFIFVRAWVGFFRRRENVPFWHFKYVQIREELHENGPVVFCIFGCALAIFVPGFYLYLPKKAAQDQLEQEYAQHYERIMQKSVALHGAYKNEFIDSEITKLNDVYYEKTIGMWGEYSWEVLLVAIFVVIFLSNPLYRFGEWLFEYTPNWMKEPIIKVHREVRKVMKRVRRHFENKKKTKQQKKQENIRRHNERLYKEMIKRQAKEREEELQANLRRQERKKEEKLQAEAMRSAARYFQAEKQRKEKEREEKLEAEASRKASRPYGGWCKPKPPRRKHAKRNAQEKSSPRHSLEVRDIKSERSLQMKELDEQKWRVQKLKAEAEYLAQLEKAKVEFAMEQQKKYGGWCNNEPPRRNYADRNAQERSSRAKAVVMPIVKASPKNSPSSSIRSPPAVHSPATRYSPQKLPTKHIVRSPQAVPAPVASSSPKKERNSQSSLWSPTGLGVLQSSPPSNGVRSKVAQKPLPQPTRALLDSKQGRPKRKRKKSHRKDGRPSSVKSPSFIEKKPFPTFATIEAEKKKKLSSPIKSSPQPGKEPFPTFATIEAEKKRKRQKIPQKAYEKPKKISYPHERQQFRSVSRPRERIGEPSLSVFSPSPSTQPGAMPQNISDWTVKDVVNWVEAENLNPNVAKCFEKEEIDGEVIFEMEKDDVKEILGEFQSKGLCLKVWRRIKALRKKHENSGGC